MEADENMWACEVCARPFDLRKPHYIVEFAEEILGSGLVVEKYDPFFTSYCCSLACQESMLRAMSILEEEVVDICRSCEKELDMDTIHFYSSRMEYRIINNVGIPKNAMTTGAFCSMDCLRKHTGIS